MKDKSPAGWTVANGIFTVNKPVGNIETKRSFKNYQLHIEWRIPENVTGESQARGNSGVFLASTGAGDGGYEMQIMDSFQNKTYVNGQAASIYKQGIPLANAARKPGEWQAYDIIWTAPTFNADGSIKTPALRHGIPQRRSRTESLRAERRDGVHRQAAIQEVRHGAHQAPGARRSKPAHQLPEHLGARVAVRCYT